MRKPEKTAAELKAESLERSFAGKTDRQLLEVQTHLAQINSSNIERIKKNVQFFFWITIVSIVLWFLIFVLAETELFKN